jgi:hypothetical protein
MRIETSNVLRVLDGLCVRVSDEARKALVTRDDEIADLKHCKDLLTKELEIARNAAATANATVGHLRDAILAQPKVQDPMPEHFKPGTFVFVKDPTGAVAKKKITKVEFSSYEGFPITVDYMIAGVHIDAARVFATMEEAFK